MIETPAVPFAMRLDTPSAGGTRAPGVGSAKWIKSITVHVEVLCMFDDYFGSRSIRTQTKSGAQSLFFGVNNHVSPVAYRVKRYRTHCVDRQIWLPAGELTSTR